MEEKILSKIEKMKDELKGEIGKVDKKVDNLAVELGKTNERIDKLEEGQEKILERVDKLEVNQDKIFKRMDRIDENQVEFNAIQFETNAKLDSLIIQNRNLYINQVAMIKMQTQFLKDQKQLREDLNDAGYFVS